MFDNLLRELRALERRSITVPIDSDEKGYIDKECPSTNCEFQFKIKVSVRRRHLDAGGPAQCAVVTGLQRWGSNSSTRLAGWVGSRCRTSLR